MTQPRLPVFDPAHATAEQKALLDDILSGPRGNLNGPFVSWIHSPELGQLAQKLGAYCRYGTGLPLRLSELAILTTAAQWQSQAEWHIHQPIAVDAGLSAQVAEQIRLGQTPSFEQEDERVVWSFATELYRDKRVADATYARAAELFGLRVVVNLIGLLGYYALVAMTLNVFGMRAEGQAALPFPEPPSCGKA
ncbi:carboxymuconolactone decarboxylase family protein [Herbaspirillum sp. RV1423]|uniref:carboxymuconolactone decarboxylase family protein n=1 Tax=Herbaspirillum sp. RV1423 TaxID=1443993 RepID=UPI0004AEE51E|nr:4-carboxymuconolactone decarboxylase [Herbaspirillum sp. RV1423]